MGKDITKQIEINGRNLQIKITNWAEQAAGSCLVQLGDTEVLATAVMSPNEPEGFDFFPLTVDYEERYYAAGRIFGSRFIRREGRPADEAILSGRMIDRTIRPCFPKDFKRETQIIITCLSWDGENDPDVLGLIAASTALSISDIPFLGPVALVRIGKIDGKWVFNPTYEQREKSDIDLLLSGVDINGKVLTNMIEMRAKEISETEVIEATKVAEPELKKIIDFQRKIASDVGKQKITIPVITDSQLEKEVKEFAEKKLAKAIKELKPKEKELSTISDLKDELVNLLEEKYPACNAYGVADAGRSDPNKIKLGLELFEEEVKKAIHLQITKDNKRPDGRKRDELREVSCQVGVLPRAHGSGLFSRGLTRVLSILTLAMIG